MGRKLAARVLKSWIEDFVDEDTGEVTSIERNEIIIERETILGEEEIEKFWSRVFFHFVAQRNTQHVGLLDHL